MEDSERSVSYMNLLLFTWHLLFVPEISIVTLVTGYVHCHVAGCQTDCLNHCEKWGLGVLLKAICFVVLFYFHGNDFKNVVDVLCVCKR